MKRINAPKGRNTESMVVLTNKITLNKANSGLVSLIMAQSVLLTKCSNTMSYLTKGSKQKQVSVLSLFKIETKPQFG